MVEPEVVRQMRELSAMGWGSKRIAQELGVARNTVKRYLRHGAEAEIQVRPKARRLDADARAEAKQLFVTVAEGNAVVVAQELATRGIEASVRTIQRAVEDERRAKVAADVATVRYETAPGQQMQVDFGEKRVSIAGVLVKVFLLAAVLGYSRRIFVRAFLAERGDDWREGIAAAFEHFGGVPRTLLIDNARPLVSDRDRETQTVTLHPAFAAFCKDWDVVPRACMPYRARTKGKVESGVKYVKRNALAGRRFASFAELERHLEAWTLDADRRVHGTTHERPTDRFEREETAALRPLPERPRPAREQRLRRRVGNDAFVHVDTVRYSVPHRFVREHVEIAVGDAIVRVFRGTEVIAEHARSREPYAVVADSTHFDGLWRAPSVARSEPEPADQAAVETFGRTLDDYAAIVGGEAWR
jgi:transposase